MTLTLFVIGITSCGNYSGDYNCIAILYEIFLSDTDYYVLRYKENLALGLN